MSLVVRKLVFRVFDQVQDKPAVQPLKMARHLKFRITKVEGLYYPCSENKGADQLRGYRKADLRLRFRLCKKPVFSRRGSYSLWYSDFVILTAKLICIFVFAYMQKAGFLITRLI